MELPCSLLRLCRVSKYPSVFGLSYHCHLLMTRMSLAVVVESFVSNEHDTILASPFDFADLFHSTIDG